MALHPGEQPRDFVLMFVAAISFGARGVSPAQAFEEAEQFVAEAERRYGPIQNRRYGEDPLDDYAPQRPAR